MSKMTGDEFRAEVSSLVRMGARILDILTTPVVGDVEVDEWESLTKGLRESVARIALEVAKEANEIVIIIDRIAPFIFTPDPHVSDLPYVSDVGGFSKGEEKDHD